MQTSIKQQKWLVPIDCRERVIKRLSTLTSVQQFIHEAYNSMHLLSLCLLPLALRCTHICICILMVFWVNCMGMLKFNAVVEDRSKR